MVVGSPVLYAQRRQGGFGPTLKTASDAALVRGWRPKLGVDKRMAQSITVVTVALPSVAQALRFTGQFANVIPVDTTGGLRNLLTSGQLTPDPSDKLFVFSDRTTVDTSQALPTLINRLVTMGSPVMVVATSPAASDLVQQCQGAGLLEGPLTVNQVLGAAAGMVSGGLSPVSEHENVAVPLDGTEFIPPATPTENPFGQGAPAKESPPVNTSGNPFGAAPGQEAATPSATPVQETIPASATSNPFGQRPEVNTQQETTQPFSAHPTQATGDGNSGNPFGSPPQTPQNMEPPASSGQQGTNPFSGGSAATAPVQDNTSATPAGQVGSNPFGGMQPSPQPAADPTDVQTEQSPSPTPVVANPFGSPSPEAGSAPASNPFSGTPANSGEPANAPFGATASPGGTESQGGNPFGGATSAGAFADGSATQSAEGGNPFGGNTGAVTTVDPASAPFGIPARREGVVAQSGPQRLGKVITVTAPKGGTGKSTMSLNLAAYLGLRLRATGRNVCLMDANIQQADTGKYLGQFTPNVEGLMKDEASIHPDRITNHLAPFPEVNISALLGPINPDSANPQYYNSRRYASILEALRPNFDYIIIDTPVAERYHDMVSGFALPNSDFIIVVVAPNATTLMNTDMWLHSVTAPKSHNGLGVDPHRVGWVLNRLEDNIGLDEDEIRNELSAWSFLGSIPETPEWKRCNNENTVVATKNYYELNQAFSQVLQQATGEQLVETGTSIEPVRTGLKDRIGRMFKKGGK